MSAIQHELSPNYAALRREMIKTQIVSRGIHDRRVLKAMENVSREDFVPAEYRDLAYTDQPLPIPSDQTISQPYTVAFMCQALNLRGGERVLEIGTGSGYGAAVLSQLAAEVITVERIPDLATTAAVRLAKLGYDTVQVHAADGSLGWAADAPYDAIVVTAAAETLPPPYIEQLKEGGRIVIPIGKRIREQIMCRYTRRGDELIVEELGPFCFVPLVGVHGWHKSNDA